MDVHEFSVECVTRAPNAYTAIIAVKDDVGDGLPLNLRGMNLEPYKRNPVVMFAHGKGFLGAPGLDARGPVHRYPLGRPWPAAR